jgi:hypothetical protein
MTIRAILTVAMGLALLSAGGCEQPQPIRDDLSRALSSPPKPQGRKVAIARPVARTKAPSVDGATPSTPDPALAATDSAATAPASSPAATEAAATSPAPPPPNASPVRFAGKSEKEIRALLGPPTEELNRPPGKRWLYRDGQCTLSVQFFPDIQTKQFAALSYEVGSDNDTDEGRRLCFAQFQSRAQARSP